MKNTISTLLFLFTAVLGFSQGWQRFYGENSALNRFIDAVQLPDGDYLLLGNGGLGQGVTITRTNEVGIQKWRRFLPAGVNCIQMHLLASGNIELISNNRILEIDTAATLVLSKVISPGISTAYVTRLLDGYISLIPSSLGVIEVRKIDFLGGQVWNKIISVSNFIPGGQATATPDGGFLYAAANPPDVGLAKIDTDGNLEWLTTGGSPVAEGNSVLVIATSDGGYAVLSSLQGFTSVERILKFDANGVLLWWEEIAELPQYGGWSNYFQKFIETADGGFAFAGNLSNNIDNHPYIMKVSNTGAYEFSHVSPFKGSFYSLLQSNDGGYHAIGQATNLTAGSTPLAYALKLGSNGVLFPNYLQGQVVLDEDEDCLNSSGDLPLSNWIVRATGAYPSYGVTDADGRYSIGVDTGAYILEVISPNNLWSPCANAIPVTVANIGDTVTTDFPIQIFIDCPAMQVDIGTPFLRRCFDNTITVQYCNLGTVTAENAFIEVTLDDLLELQSSTIPYSAQTGNTYTFPVGNVGISECSSFSFTAYVNCEVQLGETLCMEAHAFPDTICGISFSWSGASMMARASCQGDSTVVLELENVGTAPTSEPIDYIVIEDQIIFMQGSEVFEPGELSTIEQPANGATWRITSEQEPNHPGNSIPTAFVEGCGTNDVQTFSTGFANEHPQNDGDGFIDIDCEEVTGSYDPNDKMGLPKGYGAQHYIEPNTDLEYRIRFQNTGTDTAFTVVIRDTLSPFLDPASLRAGAASHNYEFDLEGDAVAIFRFENILLPDSNVNEALSHGFVSFSISQKPDVALESVIENEAAIYFDFNEPVITNQVFHTIGRNFIEVSNDINELPKGLGALLSYPNPSAGEVTFEIPSEQPVKATFMLYDSFGRIVMQKGFEGQRFYFNGLELPKGIYFYHVNVEGLGRYSGKVSLK